MKLIGKVGIVSAMTGISRVFGLLREILMAHFFGTSTLQSAFVIAFRIPNLFRRLFGEGALGAAFIPIFTEIAENEGRERAQLFLGRILGILICVLGLLVGLCIAGTFVVEVLCGPGSRWTEAMPLTRIMLPYALFICLVAILSAVLNVKDRFAVPSLTPVILNVVWIAVLVALCPFLPAEGGWRIGAVCWGILLAGIAQILFQLPALRQVGFAFRPVFSGWRDSPYIKQVLLQMGPASLGIALAQINICMDGLLAFWAATWAPSALEYADRIIYLPLGLFGTAFATVLLPTYSRQVAANTFGEVTKTLTGALSNLMLLMAPMTVICMTLASPIVTLIYKHGAFGDDSVRWTARAILAYAPGLIVFSANKTIVPIFYAQKDIKTPVKVATWCIFGNFTCNLLAVLFLPDGWKHAGIAGSTVLSSLINTVVLLLLLSRRRLMPNLLPIAFTLAKALAASALAVLPAVWGIGRLAHFPLPVTLFAGLIVFGVLYPVFCAILMPNVLRDTLAGLPGVKRFFRKRP